MDERDELEEHWVAGGRRSCRRLCGRRPEWRVQGRRRMRAVSRAAAEGRSLAPDAGLDGQ